MHLSEGERAAVREHLEQRRTRTAARLHALERDLAHIVEASSDAVRDDEHDPEGATIAFERAQVASLLADARIQMQAIDDALERLAGPDGGTCTRCGGAIGFQRLLARPATTRCIACAGAGR